MSEPMTFDDALARYLADLTAMAEADRVRRYPNAQPKVYTADPGGQRYVRVVVADQDGMSRSAHSFIERATGNILKPDGWKRPAKGVRGNIYTYGQVFEVASPYSANYSR